jgi:hypothetical protein
MSWSVVARILFVAAVRLLAFSCSRFHRRLGNAAFGGLLGGLIVAAEMQLRRMSITALLAPSSAGRSALAWPRRLARALLAGFHDSRVVFLHSLSCSRCPTSEW